MSINFITSSDCLYFRWSNFAFIIVTQIYSKW